MRSRTLLSFAIAALFAATLTAMMNGPMNVVLKDANGGISNVSTYDVLQSNGEIHVIDHVLLPRM